MRIGLYPGSFNPWHVGHQDILDKALKVFDKVIVMICQNPEKKLNDAILENFLQLSSKLRSDKVIVHHWESTILGFLKSWREVEGNKIHGDIIAMVRGLRNGMDLEYEIAQQGLHEDTGNYLPFVCFLTDRKYGHVSSSAVRALDKLGLDHGYTTI